MAAKKKGSESKIHLNDAEMNPFQALYAMLIMLQAVEDPSDIYQRYPYKNGNISVAIPGIKYGVALDNDDIAPFTKDGWHIERLTKTELDTYAKVFRALDNSRIAKTYAKVDPNIKTTSVPEEKIYSELQRRVLPIPDRNYKFYREDGTELTTPDFTWEKERIVFFMDGSYWHSVKQDNDIMKAIAKDKKLRDDIAAKRKDKVINDNEIRTELTLMGWRVLICSDEDLKTSAGVMNIVDKIEKALKMTQYSMEIKYSSSDEESDRLMDEIMNRTTQSEDPEDTESETESTSSEDIENIDELSDMDNDISEPVNNDISEEADPETEEEFSTPHKIYLNEYEEDDNQDYDLYGPIDVENTDNSDPNEEPNSDTTIGQPEHVENHTGQQEEVKQYGDHKEFMNKSSDEVLDEIFD